MTSDLSKSLRGFEDIRQIDESGLEYWSARDLMPLFGYETWEKFTSAIERAKISLTTNGIDPILAFRPAAKSYKGRNRHGEFESNKPDYHIIRFGCYLIAQNGDPRKLAIARAQAYFTIQTIRQEEYDKLPEDEKRLYIREQVQDGNKRLNASAQQHGVENYAYFHNAGYIGLYGMGVNAIRAKKGIGKDNILDRAGSTELAANLFRITQTEDKLHKDLNEGKRHGQHGAEGVHRQIGAEVRSAIEKIGGDTPEKLKPAIHIKKVKRLSATDRPRLYKT